MRGPPAGVQHAHPGQTGGREGASAAAASPPSVKRAQRRPPAAEQKTNGKQRVSDALVPPRGGMIHQRCGGRCGPRGRKRAWWARRGHVGPPAAAASPLDKKNARPRATAGGLCSARTPTRRCQRSRGSYWSHRAWLPRMRCAARRLFVVPTPRASPPPTARPAQLCLARWYDAPVLARERTDAPRVAPGTASPRAAHNCPLWRDRRAKREAGRHALSHRRPPHRRGGGRVAR